MTRRFYYYLVLLNMVANIMMFTPEILLKERFKGSVQALIWAAFIGTFFIYGFNYFMKNFKGKSLLDLLKEAFPVWMQKLIIFYFLGLWLTTALLSLSIFTFIILTFMNPNTNMLIITLLLGGMVSFAAALESDKILYLLEIILVISIPFLVFILYKSLVNPYFSWASCLEIATYVNRFPSFLTVSTATYLYSGYANMVIFNKCFNKNVTFKHLWLLGVLGLLISVHSFFVPIGFNGTVAVEHYQHPWIATADSIRMTYGIIERLLYPFLMLYTFITLIHSIIHFHVSLQFIKGLLPSNFFWKGKRAWFWPMLFLFSTYLLNLFTSELGRLQIAKWWLILRFPSEGVLIIILFFIKRRLLHGKSSSKKNPLRID